MLMTMESKTQTKFAIIKIQEPQIEVIQYVITCSIARVYFAQPSWIQNNVNLITKNSYDGSQDFDEKIYMSLYLKKINFNFLTK